MTSNTNTSEGNSDYTRSRRAGTGRSYAFDTLCRDDVDPRSAHSVPPSINPYLSWYPAEEPPARYNTSQGLQQNQAYNDVFQFGYRDEPSLTGTAAYPGHQTFNASHPFVNPFRGSVAPPQLSRELILPRETQETDPPVLGVDISVFEVESILRDIYNLGTAPVHINSIPDPPIPFTYIALTQITIWSSQHRRLTLADIYSCLENKFSYFRNPDTTTRWRGNIRHLLSLKKCFVKSDDKHAGRHYWSLDYRYLQGGDKRERRRGNRKARDDPIKREEEEADEILELDEDSSSSPSPSFSQDRYFTSTSIARSSNTSITNTRSGPSYPLQNSPPLLPYSSYSVAGEGQTFSPGPVEGYDPSGRQLHQSGRLPHHAPVYPPVSATPLCPNAFEQSHFPTGYLEGSFPTQSHHRSTE